MKATTTLAVIALPASVVGALAYYLFADRWSSRAGKIAALLLGAGVAATAGTALAKAR